VWKYFHASHVSKDPVPFPNSICESFFRFFLDYKSNLKAFSRKDESRESHQSIEDGDDELSQASLPNRTHWILTSRLLLMFLYRRWRNFLKNFEGTCQCIYIKRFFHSQYLSLHPMAVSNFCPYISEPTFVLLESILHTKEMLSTIFTIFRMGLWKSSSATWLLPSSVSSESYLWLMDSRLQHLQWTLSFRLVHMHFIESPLLLTPTTCRKLWSLFRDWRVYIDYFHWVSIISVTDLQGREISLDVTYRNKWQQAVIRLSNQVVMYGHLRTVTSKAFISPALSKYWECIQSSRKSSLMTFNMISRTTLEKGECVFELFWGYITK